MTYPEAIQFLYQLRWFGLKLGLENTFKLAALAGNPQEGLRFIHVADTNEKGSTCAMLESIYRAAGLRVGLFTSPHLVSFRERIQVNRQLISEEDVVRLVAHLREHSSAGASPAQEAEGGCISRGGHAGIEPQGSPSGRQEPCCGLESRAPSDRRDACPTFFEFVTVMALKYFAEQHCDLLIWETGMGGRLDATNIVNPLASIITNIQFDHQKWLGNTLEEIAAEKAGIIKPGVPVITATDALEALEVIAKTAIERNAVMTLVNRPEPTPNSPLKKAPGEGTGTTTHADLRENLVGRVPSRGEHGVFEQVADPSQEGKQRITAPDSPLPSRGVVWDGVVDELALRLVSEHQRWNAALAVATARVLQNKISVTDEAIRRGLETVQWPGRSQLVTTASGQTFLLDGAHNAAGAVALREAVCSGAIQRAIPDRSSVANAVRDLCRLVACSTLILGVLEDKDWQQICAALAPLAGRILLVPVPSERTAAPELLRDACARVNPAAQTIACPSLAAALKQTANDPFVIITGSLYLVGEAMEWLGLSPAPTASERGLNEWTLKK